MTLGYLAPQVPWRRPSGFAGRAQVSPGSITRSYLGLDPEVIEVVAADGYPEWFNDVAVALNAFGHLQTGWNSYQASVPSEKAVRSALELLVDLIDSATFDVPAPAVSPNPAGSVSLEWGTSDRSIEFEVFPGGTVTVVVDEDDEVDEWETGLFIDEGLRSRLRTFFAA